MIIQIQIMLTRKKVVLIKARYNFKITKDINNKIYKTKCHNTHIVKLIINNLLILQIKKSK